jgi:hypothetical protein
MYQDDPIVEEIRYYRKKHAEKYDNDLDKIFEALKKSEKISKRKFVNFGPKRLLSVTSS